MKKRLISKMISLVKIPKISGRLFSVILKVNKTTMSMFSPVRLIIFVAEQIVNIHEATTLNNLMGTTFSALIQFLCFITW